MHTISELFHRCELPPPPSLAPNENYLMTVSHEHINHRPPKACGWITLAPVTSPCSFTTSQSEICVSADQTPCGPLPQLAFKNALLKAFREFGIFWHEIPNFLHGHAITLSLWYTLIFLVCLTSLCGAHEFAFGNKLYPKAQVLYATILLKTNSLFS